MRPGFIASILATVFLVGCADDPLKTELFKKREGAKSAVTASDQLVTRSLDLATQARSKGDSLAAASLYRQVIAQNPDNLEAQIGLGHVLLDADEVGEAENVAKRLLTGRPQDDRVLALSARVSIRRNDLETATTRLALAEAIAPNSRDVLVTHGILYDLRGDHVAAQESYNKALRTAPEDRAALSNLALSVLASGDPARAAAMYEGMMKEGANSAQIRHNLALAYGLLGRDAEARKLLSGDLTGTPLESTLAYYQWLRQRKEASILPITAAPPPTLGAIEASPLKDIPKP